MAQLRNRGSNVWQIVIYLGKDNEGKKQSQSETFYGSKPQAKAYGNDLEKELKRNRMGPSKSVAFTINDLFNKWLTSIKSTISIRTYESYEYQTRRLRPFIGDLQLYTLTNFQLMERLQLLENEKLAIRTIKDFHTTLRTAINWGSVFNLVEKDVLNGVKPPRLERKSRDVFKLNELGVFIVNAKGYKYYLVLRVLALTGMRISEVLGLTWSNVDFDHDKIKITQSADLKHRVSKETKTVNSLRELELDEETMNEFRLEKKKSIGKCSPDDFVFQGENGKPTKYTAIWKTKEAVLRKARLHHVRIHDLRHGMGSILLDNGIPLTAVAGTLGQVPATTAGVYGHALRRGKSIANLLSIKII